MTRVRGCYRSEVGTRVEPLQTALQQFTQLWVNRVFLLSDRRKPGHRILRKNRFDHHAALGQGYLCLLVGRVGHIRLSSLEDFLGAACSYEDQGTCGVAGGLQKEVKSS